MRHNALIRLLNRLFYTLKIKGLFIRLFNLASRLEQ